MKCSAWVTASLCLVCACAVAALLPASASALLSTGDGGWSWQSPLPQGNNLEAVSVIDPQHAFAVGDNGTLLSTSDGGVTWAAHDAGIAGAHFNDVSFPNIDDGWAAVWLNAANGGALLRFIVHTTDGGTSWTRQGSISRGGVGAWSLDFISANRGWACGGNTVWSTQNGGSTWSAVHLRSINWYLQDVRFTDAHHGWAVGYRTAVYGSSEYPIILATTDGGLTWEKQFSPGGVNEGELDSVSFGDAAHGWAVGPNLGELTGDLVLATTDGGSTWTPQTTGAAGKVGGVDFVGAAHGWIADGATVLATTDGGSSWATQNVGVSVGQVSFSDTANGCVVGPDGDLATTTDGGANWQVRGPTDPATPLPLLDDITFVDASHGSAVGQNVILTTTDGGASWTSQPAGSGLTSVRFAGAADGWAVGGPGPSGQVVFGGDRVILHTTDGGVSWQKQFDAASTSGGGFEDVTCVDADHAWAAGGTRMGAPCVGRTTDGGASWHFVKLATGVGRVHAVSFVDARHGWAVGYGGGIYRTTDGGATWRRQHTVDVALNDVVFVDAHHGWAVGGTGDPKGICGVLRTTDGGAHWTRQDLSARQAGMRVAFADRRHGWIACGPTVRATVDGGRHWRVQRTGSYVTGLAFLDATHGWAVAQTADWTTGHGGILTTTTGGFASP